jgi:hypothetical protein
MEHRTIRGNRSMTPQWHRSQVVKAMERLYCPCGALVYEGPKPTFARVSCPKCKKIMDLRRP